MLPALFVLAFAMPPAQAEDILTLNHAYERVLQHNPEMRGYLARIDAAEGNRVQQSLAPNPEAVFEAENFAGDGTRKGFESAEYTLGIEQKIEIAGKRSKREQVASLEKQHVSEEARAAVQFALAQTKAGYMRVAIAQERLALAQKRVRLADKTHTIVKKRVHAAKAADIQHAKADIEVSAAEVEERRAVKELDIARTALANMMGEDDLGYGIVEDFSALPDVPDQESLMQALDETPMSVMSRIALMRQEAELELAKADGVPDPTFGLSVRRFSEDDGSAFLASMSIPLTFFDRNQGRIAEVKANVAVAEADQEVLRLNLNKQAMELWQTLMGAREDVLAYQDDLLPSARNAYAQAEQGFDRGAFSFLDLLDAQRTLFDVQESHLEALSTFHETKARLDVLTGEYEAVANQAFTLSVNEKE